MICFFNDTATTDIYTYLLTLSLHDALPISILVIGAVFPDKPEEQGLKIMSRICELTGKTRQVGHNVSHANNKTKRVFLPNLQDVTLTSEPLEKTEKLRVSTNGLRSAEHVGGIDNWLSKTAQEQLSLRASASRRDNGKKQKT